MNCSVDDAQRLCTVVHNRTTGYVLLYTGYALLSLLLHVVYRGAGKPHA